MAKRRKKFTMLLTVSVPREMSAAEARREVRTLVSEQCFYSEQWYDGDIKALKCRPVKMEGKPHGA